MRIVAALTLLTAVRAGSASSSINAAPQTDASITIDASRPAGPTSELLYGQFIEFMFEGIKGGLGAELLRDRGFEQAPNAIGLPRDWERYPDDRNDDYGMEFRWDAAIAYPAKSARSGHALRVDLREGVVARHGIYQARIPVRQGLDYRGSLWLKSAGYEGRIRLALEADGNDGEIYTEAGIDKIHGDWKKYEFALRPAKSDSHARFAILFEGRGRLWIDQISLLPGDAVDGVRADVIERIKALRPAFIRWPGGNVAQDYRWQWGVGPRDERPTWINLSWKKEEEPGDFGTDEFLRFCRNVGAEPSITVNVEGGGATAAEAAAWVEYCNGPANSKYGAMRAANGHAEPYGVKYWEIGNEIWGNWVRGHSNAPTYARNATRYIAAMRAVDPSIRIIAVGDNDQKWNRTVLRLAGGNIDYLAIHHYYGKREMQGEPRNLLARPLHYERFYRETAQLIRDLQPRRPIKLAINEWGLDLPEAQQYSMLAALYGARLMNVFERSSDIVAMSAVSDLVNGWPGGIIQAGRHKVFVTPAYLVNRLYAHHHGAQKLSALVESPSFDSRDEKGVPALDAVASRSADGRQIFIKAVNADLAKSLRTRIRLKGVAVASSASVETLTAPSLAAANSFATPDAVSVRRSEVSAGNEFSIELPAHSVSVLALNVSPLSPR